MSGNNFAAGNFTERRGVIVNDDEIITIRFCSSPKALCAKSPTEKKEITYVTLQHPIEVSTETGTSCE